MSILSAPTQAVLRIHIGENNSFCLLGILLDNSIVKCPKTSVDLKETAYLALAEADILLVFTGDGL